MLGAGYEEGKDAGVIKGGFARMIAREMYHNEEISILNLKKEYE